MFQTVTYGILWVLVYLVGVFLQLLIKIGDLSSHLKNDVGNKFDYIIVGGGSAGAILAGRLSQNPNVTVLLIEAGNEGFDILNIPVLGPVKQLSGLDWQYETIPQNESCLGLQNNVSKWPSGKILGGSTHLNYMIYLKGHKRDYVTWKDPLSNHWDWHDINYYYNKAVENVCMDQNDNCQEKKGSILVRSELLHTTELSDAILKAAAELNYTVNNLNSNRSTGFMKPHLNMNERGRRWTSDQYLKRLRHRKNLKVVTNAMAEKIFLKDDFEAYAIRYRSFGASKTVYAEVEIIVSAGTVGSAKLLMLSGIGPADVLSRAKIRTKIDLPVGKNLQDHVTTGLDLVVLDKNSFSFTDLMLPSSAYQYFVHGIGPFTSNMVEALGVVHSRLVNPAQDRPDLEFMIMSAGLSSDKGVFFKKSMGISEKVWENYFRYSISESVISILPVLLHPKSLGEVTLHPNNPHGKPMINPRYLSHFDDVKTLIEGIRIIQRMIKAPALREFGAKLNTRKFPGCESVEFDSDDYWHCYLRQLTLTVYHPVGTCKMAPPTENGVVDHRLRVYGTNKLRVVDASVMPTLPSANTNAAVIMIAEKGADLIAEDFRNRSLSCRIFMSMVKAYHGKKCSDLQLCCSTWTSANTCPQEMLTRNFQMNEEDDWNCGNSSISTQTYNDKTESWIESDKYVPLDPPPEFQDHSISLCIEKFASDLVYKLISDAYLVSCKMSWSIPCSQECHMSESLSNNLTSWNGFRLCWTPELLSHKRLSSLSASHNSLSTISSNFDDSSYIKSAVSHDVLTSKQISDMYNVPFDSDIYAVPVDVVQDYNRKYDTASDYMSTNAKCRKPREASTEPIHVTVEEVRQYLHTLYSSEASEEGKPAKKLRNNEVKSMRSQFGKPKKTKDISSGRSEKLKKCRQSFSMNIKETLCNIFRKKKLHSSDHCLGRRDATRSDEIGMRLSGHYDQNPPSPISKPSISKRALPPLPKGEDSRGGIISADSTPLPSPEDFPSPPPLPFRTKEASVSVDFASSIEKVKDYGWYWGPISGEAAEKILSNEPDGSFIVRDSSDDYYIFSLTFKLNSIIRHVRIEHDKGNFSFGSSTRFKSHTIVDFIESAVEHSRSGRYLFFLHRRPVLGPMRVQLLHPVSRFKQVQSLQHMCRFVILKMVRRDLIQLLPLPRRVLDYLSTQHYYSEDLLDDARSLSREDLDQLLPFRQEVFS